MSTADIAITVAGACYLVTVASLTGSLVWVALAYRKQARIAAPPKESVQPDTSGRKS